MGKTEQAKNWVLERSNRPKIGMGQTDGSTQTPFFSLGLGVFGGSS